MTAPLRRGLVQLADEYYLSCPYCDHRQGIEATWFERTHYDVEGRWAEDDTEPCPKCNGFIGVRVGDDYAQSFRCCRLCLTDIDDCGCSKEVSK